MATYTNNYNLKKPALGDYYNIADFNGNADVIDAQMKTNADAIATKQKTLVEVTFSIAVSDWVGSSAPYTATKTVTGITASSKGYIGANTLGASDSLIEAITGAQMSVSSVGTNTVTIKAYGDKPTVAIPCIALIG